MRSISGFCSSSVPLWVDLYNVMAISRSAMAPGLSLIRALEMPLAWWAENLSLSSWMRSIASLQAESSIVLLATFGY
jgi:hypothetical protein